MTLLVGSIFHMTRKIVSEMTYNVSMGTLNPTIPYQYSELDSIIHTHASLTAVLPGESELASERGFSHSIEIQFSFSYFSSNFYGKPGRHRQASYCNI